MTTNPEDLNRRAALLLGGKLVENAYAPKIEMLKSVADKLEIETEILVCALKFDSSWDWAMLLRQEMYKQNLDGNFSVYRNTKPIDLVNYCVHRLEANHDK